MIDTAQDQYVTFTIADDMYAVPVVCVREVLEYTKLTKLPRSPDFMKGIMNLRGNSLPVIDLHQKFGMGETALTKDSAILVLDIESRDGTLSVGVLADSVHEVTEIAAGMVEPAPHVGTGPSEEFIHGIGKRDGAFIIILDVGHIFNTEEANSLKHDEQT